MLKLVKCLISQLNTQNIRYCHWKSNFHLKAALEGKGDLDLLVDRKDAQRFEQILACLRFKQAIDPLQPSHPSVFHFYGFDIETGRLVHLHIYYRVITGESLVKNYSLPFEELLLQNTGQVDSIPVPQVSAELLIFVLRVMAKHGSILEYYLVRRNDDNYQEELKALQAGDTVNKCTGLLAEWLPSVSGNLFVKCMAALQKDTSFIYRYWLVLKLRKQLKPYNRYEPLQEMFLRVKVFSRRVIHRLWGGKKSKQFATGGIIIAFVGPEATGKSTLVYTTTNWLGKAFEVTSVHLGKPPSTWLTFLPNLALPLLRRIAPKHRLSQVQNTLENNDTKKVLLLYSVRSILVAWDRRALAVKMRRKAANGSIVISDRYPSATIGAMDSPKLENPEGSRWRDKFVGYLARLEHRIYRQIPLPDVVIQLSVPVGVAIERNRTRQKVGKESDAYVLSRHATSVTPSFPTAKVVILDSNRPEAQTIDLARQIIWDNL